MSDIDFIHKRIEAENHLNDFICMFADLLDIDLCNKEFNYLYSKCLSIVLNHFAYLMANNKAPVIKDFVKEDLYE